jgi:hypothetical protein
LRWLNKKQEKELKNESYNSQSESRMENGYRVTRP